MTKAISHPLVALAAAIDLPDSADAPEWVHLLPAAMGEIQTYDQRGPYKVADLAAVIAASMHSERGMPIDENHATDLSAAVGGAAPARGWITELQARADGLWGRVRWTNAGKELMSDRAYRGLSPVFNHTADNVITRVLRASLTNKPNLKGLTSLNTENSTMNLAAIAKATGLGEDATEDAILTAIGKMKAPGDAPALQTAMAEIGVALGVQGNDPVTILAAAKAAKTTDGSITALQTELTKVTGQLTVLQTEGATAKAAAFVDGEIAKGRQCVKPLRDHYIAMHVQDAARVEKEISAFTLLGPTGQVHTQPPGADAELTALNAEQLQVADQLGIPHDKFLASLQADAKKGAR
ncbi:phage protease [Cypionkella psychrotolerans]|uniref:phage protease n=1 Tax=Cypionkella psychrotolerans TaxID=1678131 RepID=UPI0006B5D856|nr:phage protease [Cypionkella psychrotolerans]